MPRGRPKKKKIAIDVKVSRTGGKLVEVCLDGDRTVEAALEAAEIEQSISEDIYVNSSKAGLNSKVKDGDRVVLVKNIKGGFFS